MSVLGIFLRFIPNYNDFSTPPRGRVRKSTHGLPFWDVGYKGNPPGPQFGSLFVNPWDPQFAKICTRPYAVLSGGLAEPDPIFLRF